MADAFNMIPVLLRPINEIDDHEHCLDREDLVACWNCGGLAQYVQHIYGLVVFVEGEAPMVLPVELDIYCAHCGSHHSSFIKVEDENVIMRFDTPNEAKDAEYLLYMKGEARSMKNWSDERYKELMDKIEEYHNKIKEKEEQNGAKRKRKNSKTDSAAEQH